MSRRIFCALACLLFLCSAPAWAKAKPLPAQQVLDQAMKQASAEHKKIFLIFDSTVDPLGQFFDMMFNDEKAGPILKSRYVIARIDLLEEKHTDRVNPGAEELYQKLSGMSLKQDTSIPYSLILDEKGATIVTCLRPGVEYPNANIGYPGQPEEIDWFLQMLDKSGAALTAEERSAVEGYLKRVGELLHQALQEQK